MLLAGFRVSIPHIFELNFVLAVVEHLFGQILNCLFNVGHFLYFAHHQTVLLLQLEVSIHQALIFRA
jgi:hypothetical protein